MCYYWKLEVVTYLNCVIRWVWNSRRWAIMSSSGDVARYLPIMTYGVPHTTFLQSLVCLSGESWRCKYCQSCGTLNWGLGRKPSLDLELVYLRGELQTISVVTMERVVDTLTGGACQWSDLSACMWPTKTIWCTYRWAVMRTGGNASS